MPTTVLQTPLQERGFRKERVGVVISNKMQKTIVVRVHQLSRHKKYSRVVKTGATFHAHDETNQAGIGDEVRIMETRPISKQKRWRLVEIVKRASSAPAIPGQEAVPVRKSPGRPTKGSEVSAVSKEAGRA